MLSRVEWSAALLEYYSENLFCQILNYLLEYYPVKYMQLILIHTNSNSFAINSFKIKQGRIFFRKLEKIPPPLTVGQRAFSTDIRL